MIKRFVLLFAVLCLSFSLFSTMNERIHSAANLVKSNPDRGLQIQALDGTVVTVDNLISTMLGDNVTVSNVVYTGANIASGLFSGGLSAGISIDEGVILSSGYAANAIGPNISDGISGNNNLPGDADLNTLIPGYRTNDAAILEFDFTPQFNSITFTYVFGSDEYLEYVNSSFNDVFGFFIDGVNVAILPGTTTPVAINTVNHLVNTEYFINNDLSSGLPFYYDIECDGFTTSLTVQALVNPGETHHMKLAIADAGDHILDSWVFLEAESFTSVQAQIPFQVNIEGGIIHETNEDTPIDLLVQVIGLDNSTFNWVLMDPIFGSAEFLEPRIVEVVRIIRYTPDPDYNHYFNLGGYGYGLDAFVLAVTNNIGQTIYTTIGIHINPVNDPPQNTSPPAITGDFITGTEVFCDPGSWNDDVDNQWVPPGEESTIEIFYQWQTAVDIDDVWYDIENAIDQTYLVSPVYHANYIRCQVTAQDNGIGFTGDSISIAFSNAEYVTLPNSNQEDEVSPVTRLLAACPNPFNPETKLQFILAGDSDVEVAVYNLKGQKIHTLIDQYLPTGQYSINWMGTDQYGRECPSGLYFAVMKAGKRILTQKLMLIK